MKENKKHIDSIAILTMDCLYTTIYLIFTCVRIIRSRKDYIYIRPNR